ncbi:ankyrin repeats (many copies) domain-containing protein [Ditylenchus destructor]|nr:ankyrin repeats (many copies) domain-containing protein [Ditylenchus destructor]
MAVQDTKAKFGELVERLRTNNADEAKRLISGEAALKNYEDDSGRLAIHWAASGGCLPIVELFLGADASLVKKIDDSGWTPLMISASAGRFDVVRYLFTFAETNVNHRNHNGQSCLHYACSKNHEAIARLLIDNGADVNAQDKYGASPLHRAACQGHEKIVRMLVACDKINVNIKDSGGNTPLHNACEDDNETIAIFLAKNGGDIHLQNKEEKTPLDLVKKAETRKKLLAAVE